MNVQKINSPKYINWIVELKSKNSIKSCFKYLVIVSLLFTSCSTENARHEKSDSLVVNKSEDTLSLIDTNPILSHDDTMSINKLYHFFETRGYKIDKNHLFTGLYFCADYHFKDYLYHDIESLTPCQPIKGNFLRLIIDSTSNAYRCKDFSYNINTPNTLLLTREVLIDKSKKNLYVSAPQWAKLYFHNDEQTLYQVGYNKNGKKDSVWFLNYEDYPLPKFNYYNLIVSSKDRVQFKIVDDKNQLWIEGDLYTEQALISGISNKTIGTIVTKSAVLNTALKQTFLIAGNKYASSYDSLVVISEQWNDDKSILIDKSIELFWNTEQRKVLNNLDSLLD